MSKAFIREVVNLSPILVMAPFLLTIVVLAYVLVFGDL